MNMETKFNNSDMVGFAKYIQSLYDRGMKPKKEEASSSDLENYRILKLKYINNESARDIAKLINRTETATHSLLQRLRMSLQKCINS